jgi:para-aminobenzoate synthetase component 1
MNEASTTPVGPQTLQLDLSADELVRRLLSIEPTLRLALLDSCGVSPGGGRYLVAGVRPDEVIWSDHGETYGRLRETPELRIDEPDILKKLDSRLQYWSQVNPGVPWAGGCIATFSYEFGRRFELREAGNRLAGAYENDVELAFYLALVIHDYSTGASFVAGVFPEEVSRLHARIMSQPVNLLETPTHRGSISSNFTREGYEQAVQRVKEYIAAGDIYQANLTQQMSVGIHGAWPEQMFLRLREEHPAPFAAFLRRSEDTIVSGSPERFLSVRRENGERIVEAWPIKGTRARGGDPEADDRLRRELLASAKDRAENVMIVDLMRNDLGRVCETGSVEVKELFTLQEHPSLFHLVSKVRGKLRDEVVMGDLLRATFPCGSITGAPKIRAMEVIDEVERMSRGLSMGAIGYFGFDGTADLSVAIRTMTIRNGVAKFNVGGGIVADSDPAAEYEESLVKATSLKAALGL